VGVVSRSARLRGVGEGKSQGARYLSLRDTQTRNVPVVVHRHSTVQTNTGALRYFGNGMEKQTVPLKEIVMFLLPLKFLALEAEL
jgi:hypothetical protein